MCYSMDSGIVKTESTKNLPNFTPKCPGRLTLVNDTVTKYSPHSCPQNLRSCAYYHGQSLEHSSYQEGCRHAPQRLYRSEGLKLTTLHTAALEALDSVSRASIWPCTVVRECLFHFKQALLRKAVSKPTLSQDVGEFFEYMKFFEYILHWKSCFPC